MRQTEEEKALSALITRALEPVRDHILEISKLAQQGKDQTEETARQTLAQIHKELDDIYWDFPFKKIDVRVAVLAYMKERQRLDTGVVKEDYIREVKKFTDRLNQLTELCQKTQYALNDFEQLYLIKP